MLAAEFFVENDPQKTRADGLGEFVSDGRVGRHAVLCFFHALVKCKRIYFSGANDAPCFPVHSKQRLWMLCSVLQLSSVSLPKAGVFTKSTKLITEEGKVCRLQASTRFALKNKIISEGCEPWGMPICVREGSVL